MLGLSCPLSYAVFVYFVFVFLYLCVLHMGIQFFISLKNPLFKNIPQVGSLWHFVICCICVFVYETLGNISLDIIGPRAFRKCMVRMVKIIIKWYFGHGDERTNKQTTG